MLINKGAEVNPVCVWYEGPGNIYNPLVLASKVSKEAVELLLDNGADMSYCPNFDCLFEALSLNRLDIVQVLVNRGITINESSFMHSNLNDLLEEKPPEIKNYFKNIESNSYVKLYKAIREKDINSIKDLILKEDLFGKYHLRVAIEKRSFKIVKLLLKRGFSISNSDLSVKLSDTLLYINMLKDYCLDGNYNRFKNFFAKPSCFGIDSQLKQSASSNLIYNYDLIEIMRLFSNNIKDINLKQMIEKEIHKDNIGKLLVDLINVHKRSLLNNSKLKEAYIGDYLLPPE